MRAQKKPVVFDVGEVKFAQKVLTGDGIVEILPGDFMLTDPATGIALPVRRRTFLDTYVLVNEDKVMSYDEFVNANVHG